MHWRSQLYYWRFFKSRRYQVRYHVTHASAKEPADRLILPYPQPTENQTIIDLKFTSDGTIERHEQFIACQQASYATISCSVTVTPRRLQLPTNVTAAEYHARFDYESYCQPDAFIQSNHPVIRERAQSILANETNLMRLSEQLYEHTITQLRYGQPIAGLYPTTTALTQECVDCGGFATYLGALLRACQIPCRLVAGFWAGQRLNGMHAWLEFMLPDGRWVALDPSTDHLRRLKRTRRMAGYNMVGSDRIVMSIGSDHHLHLKNTLSTGLDIHVGMLQTPLVVHVNGAYEYLPDYSFTTL